MGINKIFSIDAKWPAFYNNLFVCLADKAFMAAYMKGGDNAYTECQSNFDQERTIKFEEYKATQDMSLKACCDTEQGCTYDTGNKVEKTDFRQWYQGSIKCPAGTKKV